MRKKAKSKKKGELIKLIIAIVVALALAATGITIGIKVNEDGFEVRAREAVIEYSEEQMPVIIDGDWGEALEEDSIPTVEEVDGGRFEDADTGLSIRDGDYADLGAVIETFDTTTPEAFKNATLGKCVYASNRYGAQCVSLARSFWVSYAGRDVTTCGTGMAKGMMDCAEQNAGDDFLIFWADAVNQVQAGDWLVFDGGQYGHVGMALGSVVNGYVALLGENQGGTPCDGGGAATNIINISTKKLIGYYRPVIYVIPEPEPEPEPEPTPVVPDTGIIKFI